jgi:hypothetical protein
MSTDAYIQLGSSGVRSFGETEHHDSVVFADAPSGIELKTLRFAPYSLFRNAGVLLVRAEAPIDSPSRDVKAKSDRALELHKQLQQLSLKNLRWGLLHQPVGEPPWVEGDLDEDEVQDVLDRARAVELNALLEWGQGIWKPSTYHYRLPSGEHAAGFVRVADAIQRPRDAELLASWLHDRLADQRGLVVDTGTLSAVVQALVAAIRSRQGWRPGPINVLDGYPATAFDVASAVNASDVGSGVLGVLSVNSSGTLRDHLMSALAGRESEHVSLDILINKRPITIHADMRAGVPVRTWHPRPSQQPLISYDAANADVCALCQSAKTATLIPVSPRSFDGSLPAALARITPSVTDARTNRYLWELANERNDIIALDASPIPATADWRPPEPMSVVFDHGLLLKSQKFCDAVKANLESELRRNHRDPPPAGLVLMPAHEYACEGRARLIKTLAPILGPQPKVRPFPPQEEWPAKLCREVRAAKSCIVVLTFGAVTGTTLYGALAAVQNARDPGAYDLYGFVVHARLAEQRAWRTLQNSYANLLFAAWHSYLPERSPLRDEADMLGYRPTSSAEATLSDSALTFLRQRREFLAPDKSGEETSKTGETTSPKPEMGLFWGSTPETVLTPNSILGQGLRAPAVYVAVASTMERSRKDQRALVAPVRRVFDMPTIVRSYYDPLILAATLRWLQPHEAWWGVDPQQERSVVESVLARATDEHRIILVPELLLAAAQGKLNRQGLRAVEARAETMLVSSLSDEEKAPIELGLALRHSPIGTLDQRQQRATSASDAIEAAKTARELLDLLPAVLRDLHEGQLGGRVLEDLVRTVERLQRSSDAGAS